MSKRIICCLVAIFVLTLPVSGAWAAETMPDGVTMVVLKESPVTHLPGIVKVKLVEMRIAPGTKWMNHQVADSGFCTVLQGTMTMEVGDKTVSRFVGDTWVMKKGSTVNIYNRGTVEHVQRIWLLVEG